MINVQQFELAKRFEEQTQLFHEFKKLFAFLFRAENKLLRLFKVQVSLVFCEFVICGFNYPRPVNCVHTKLIILGHFPRLSADFVVF